MSTPEIENKIEKMKNEMNDYYNIKNGTVFNLDFLKNKNFLFGIPVLIILFFLYIKPNFLYITVKKEKKICFKKCIFFFILFNLIFFGFVYYFLTRYKFFNTK